MKKIFKKQWWLDLFGLIKKDVITKKIRSVILIIVFILAWIFWGSSSALLWLLFLSFALYDWDNIIIGVMAFISLATCTFLLALKQDALAEQMAVYAYFFLVMVVALQIIEYKRHPSK